jgi:serine/threonine protein kinase
MEGKMEVDSYKAKYKKITFISAGAGGTVYLAKNRETGQLVAVKQLDVRYVSRDTLAEVDFLIELSDINNAVGCYPHISCYYETIRTPEYVYIIMEYIAGKELHVYVKNARRDKIKDAIYDTLLQILKQILQALAYIHSKNIVHADIKPENILIKDKDYVAVLIDFGLSCRSNVENSCHKLVGTLDFLPPEVALHYTVYPASDIWSLAMSFYDTIYGRIWSFEAQRLPEAEFFKYISDPAHTPKFHTSNQILNDICNAMLVTDWKLRPSATALLEMFPPTL